MLSDKATDIIEKPTVFIDSATQKAEPMSEIGARIAMFKKAMGSPSNDQPRNADSQVSVAVQQHVDGQRRIVSLSSLDRHINLISNDCAFVSNFYHVVICSMFWAGAKTLFCNLDPEVCILPIKVTEMTKEQFPVTRNYVEMELTNTYYHVLGNKKQDDIFSWMFDHMHESVEGLTPDEVKAAREKFNDLAWDVCKRGQQFVCGMMTTLFQSLDFLLVHFTLTSLGITMGAIYMYHKDFYLVREKFDTLVLCKGNCDDFRPMDLIKYADAIDINGKKVFKHLFKKYLHAGEFAATFLDTFSIRMQPLALKL